MKTLLLLAWIAFSFPLYSATYYVATTGSNSSDGSIGTPWLTIKYGIEHIVAGDTLLIRAGSYGSEGKFDSAVTSFPSGTSWSDAPIISAYGSEVVTLDPSGNGILNLHTALSYLIWQNIVFDGVNLSQSGGGGDDISINNGVNHIRFVGCEIKRAWLNGVLISWGTGGTDYNEFINCKIHHNGFSDGSQTAYGLYITTQHNLIQGCEVNDNKGYGIHIFHDLSSSVSYNTVVGNKIYNNGITIPAQTEFGLLLSCGTGNVAYNNLVYNNAAGVQVDFRATGALVYSNTIYNNDSGGYAGLVIGENDVVSVIARNNIIYDNAGGNIQDNSGGALTADHNLTTDPTFVNAGTGDFHIQSSSVSKDAGYTLGTPYNVDYDGISRPYGSAYDIGAYEYSTFTIGSPSRLRLR